jgi:hypothetical protein
MASTFKMEMEAIEEEQLMNSFDEDGDDASDLTSLPDSERSSLHKDGASAYEDKDELTIRPTATETAEDFATLISTKDDSTLNPWTFRMWFVGLSPDSRG